MIGFSRRWGTSVVALGVLSFVAALFARAVQSWQDMETVAALTSRMKSVCVGRVLIDVPAEARVSLRLALVDGFEVTRLAENATAFQYRLRDRESRLSATPNMLGQKNLEANTEVRNNGFTGKVLVHSRRRGYSIENQRRVYVDTISVEGHVHKAGVTYRFVADTYDPARINVLPTLLARFTDRPENEIPTEPGFCLAGGLIREPYDRDRSESVAMSATLPNHPDLSMLFWTNNATAKGRTLLERHTAAMGPLMRARSRILREGARTINGHAGEEVAIKVTELNLATVFGFVWETPGSDTNVLVPHLSLEMDTGLAPQPGEEPVQSSLSEEAMLALWDKVSASIRVRSSGASETGLAEPQLAARGATAFAGVRAAVHPAAPK